METRAPQRQNLIDLLDGVPWELQCQNPETGAWEAVRIPAILGRKTARRILKSYQKENPDKRYRVLQKVMADHYREGLRDNLNTNLMVELLKDGSEQAMAAVDLLIKKYGFRPITSPLEPRAA